MLIGEGPKRVKTKRKRSATDLGGRCNLVRGQLIVQLRGEKRETESLGGSG